MKILYLTHQYFPRHTGGTEVYTRGLVRRANAAGHQTMVLTCHENPSGNPADFHVEQTRYEGVPLLEIHYNLSVIGHPARAEYDNPFVGSVVEDLLRSYWPDLVHVMHAMKLSGSALEACYEAGVPMIVTLCDFWFICPRHTLLTWNGSVCTGPDRPFKCVTCANRLHGFAARPRSTSDLVPFARDLWAIQKRRASLKRVLLKARRILALSEFQKRMFVQNGFPARRIEALGHGLEVDDLAIAAGPVDTDRGTPPASEDPRPLQRIGFIGSLVPHKGAHVLLEALASVPDLPVECLLYGPLSDDDSYVDRLRTLADLDPRVHLAGGFEPSQMGRVMRSFDLLAMPALWYENNPLVVKAALYLGVPVLASRIGSLPEMVREGQNGWLVEPDDPATWARAIKNLTEKPLPAFPSVKVKTMDENAHELFQIYEKESGK